MCEVYICYARLILQRLIFSNQLTQRHIFNSNNGGDYKGAILPRWAAKNICISI